MSSFARVSSERKPSRTCHYHEVRGVRWTLPLVRSCCIIIDWKMRVVAVRRLFAFRSLMMKSNFGSDRPSDRPPVPAAVSASREPWLLLLVVLGGGRRTRSVNWQSTFAAPAHSLRLTADCSQRKSIYLLVVVSSRLTCRCRRSRDLHCTCRCRIRVQLSRNLLRLFLFYLSAFNKVWYSDNDLTSVHCLGVAFTWFFFVFISLFILHAWLGNQRRNTQLC